MHRFTALLLAIGIGLPLLSGIYFTGLVAGWPFGISIGIIILALSGLVFGIRRLWLADNQPVSGPWVEGAALIFLLLGAVGCGLRARAYGDWDAALIWNLHARYLTTSDWKIIFQPGISGNNAYPFGLPGAVAFGWRLWGSFTPLVPFLIALLSTLSIPVVVLLQAGKGSLKRLLLIGLSFLTYRYYFALGLTQYADIQIAALLLLLFVMADRLRQTGIQGYWLVMGMLSGALAWTKVEGVLLAGLFLLFHLPDFRKSLAELRRFLLGVSPFALFWILFKTQGAPPSPLWVPASIMLEHATDGHQLRLVGQYFLEVVLWQHLRLIILLALLIGLRKKSFSPGRNFMLAATASYFLIYWLLVTTALDWNIFTSLPRLLLQLYPSLVFLTAQAIGPPASPTNRPSAGFVQSEKDDCDR